MITAIAQLGKAAKQQGEFSDDLKVLVDPSQAQDILALRIRVLKKHTKYEGLDLEENKGEARYLYRRDQSGKPGLFLTGRISRNDVHVLRRNLILLKRGSVDTKRQEAEKVKADFEKRKLIGLTQGKAVRQAKDRVLRQVCATLNKDSKKIASDIFRTIEKMAPEELLVTVKLIDDSGEKYLGDIADYRRLFQTAVTETKVEPLKQRHREATKPRCTVCNNDAAQAEFQQNPLPFFFIDKPSFMPNGDPDEAFKVFPLCTECFVDLRRGQKYVEKYLDFAVASAEGRRAEVRFWLIPMLTDLDHMGYLRKLNQTITTVERPGTYHYLYLRNLKTMCESMDAFSAVETEESSLDASEAYLCFTAVFYTNDRQGHMRLISRSEGIYPKHLRFMIETKKQIDLLDPFRQQGIRFGFPLLRDFVGDSKSGGWYATLASVLGDIFTKTPIDTSLLLKALVTKIQDTAERNADLAVITQVSLRALSVVEYVIHLEQADSIENQPSRYQTALLDQAMIFLNDHAKLLVDGTLRAVCATGIAAGILLEVQRQERGGSMPFWGRLSRLEMDLERVKGLFPQVVNKLHEYKQHRFDSLLAFLGSEEIAKLDLNQKDLSKDLVSLVFAIGLSKGYIIAHAKEAQL